MSFIKVEEAVNKWLLENPDTCIKLILSDSNENRMYFTITFSENKSVQFFIDVPTESTKNVWSIRSECDNQEFLETAKRYCATQTDVKIEELLSEVDVLSHKMITGDVICDEEEEDDYDDDDNFYEQNSDDEFVKDEPEKKSARDSFQSHEELGIFSHQGSCMATQRLLSDMKALNASKGKFGFSCCPRGDNIYVWDVKFTDFEPETSLAQDLKAYATKFKQEPSISLEMIFEETYPMTPPFVRVLRPKFKFLTGHVTIGGSICMEMLARSGWSPGNDIESILIQIRTEIISDPNARLDLRTDAQYSESEAREAFKRMVDKYKWN